MRHKTITATLLLLVCVGSAGAASLKLEGKTFDQVVQEAEKTGVVQRALRGILLLRTVRGTLEMTEQDGRINGAKLHADATEDYDFINDEKYRCAIVEKRWLARKQTYTIPADAAHFFLIRPDMVGKKVEAQIQITAPGRKTVADLRFIEAYKGQPGQPPPAALMMPRSVSKTTQSGRVYVVAQNGNDTNPGTIAQPFATIARALRELKAGDVLQLRQGTYREMLRANGVEGTPGAPVTITSAPDEKATIDGRAALADIAAGPWALHDRGRNIWRRQVGQDVIQLWRNGKMQTLARWPNITKNWTEDMAPEFSGRLPEPGTAWHIESYFTRFDTQTARANFADRRLKTLHTPDHPFQPTPFDGNTKVRKVALSGVRGLAKTGLSFTGAVVEGLGAAAVVSAHRPGTNRIELVFNDFDAEFAHEIWRGRLVLKNHLSCLDRMDEWVFDPQQMALYVRLAPGDSPDRHQYLTKTASLASVLMDCAHVTIRGIDFAGCAFRALQSPGIVVESCTFSYPTYRDLALTTRAIREAADATAAGAANTKKAARLARRDKRAAATEENVGQPAATETPVPPPESDNTDFIPAGFVRSAITFSDGGTFRDCELRYYDSAGIEMQGQAPLIENCYLHHGTEYGVVFSRSPNATARRNTIHSTLRQGAIRIRKTDGGRFTSELNYGYDFGCWRSDASGTQVQSGSQMFHMFRYNWFHHSECKAARFDGQPAGSLGTFVGNVGWRLWQGLQIKGDYQKTYNNTFFSCGARHDISVINQMAFGGGQHSITRNNLCDRISGHRQVEDLNGEGKIPGFNDHNWNGLVTKRPSKSLLRDPDNFDFRPGNSPETVDAGTRDVDTRFVPNSWIDNLHFTRAPANTTRGTLQDIVTMDGGLKNRHRRLFLGKAPDVGAYEYGDRYYWIPGRQLPNASFPIPPDNAKYVKPDADLMWLEAKAAVAHLVYLGTDHATVAGASQDAPEFLGRFTDSNIATPPNGLRKDRRYYWRVDAVAEDGTAITGDVWTFLPCDGRYKEYERIATPAQFEAKLTVAKAVTLKWTAVPDDRLAGYNVYRRWGNPEYVKIAGERLNPAPLQDTSFTDPVLPQKGKWFYVIEAVDRKGVVSEESLPAEIRVD